MAAGASQAIGAPVLQAKGDAAALARAAEHARPVAFAAQHIVPVLEPLTPLFSDGGLRRGTVVAVDGIAATSFALALAAAPSSSGSWVGAVGLPSLGLLAAAEAGLALERLVLVASPSCRDWPTVLATLLDGVDVVLAKPPAGARLGDARRLQARARERGAIVLVVGAAEPLSPDLVITTEAGEWLGLEPGAGHLRARRVTAVAEGRRSAARRRHVRLWFPDGEGRIREDDGAARVVALRETG